MTSDDDDLFLDDDAFPDDEPADGDASAEPPWIVLVVDDEQGVHDVTRLALRDFSFEGRPLEILSAYSGAEALDILGERGDVAFILLDVVMETDHAGLDCARRIREDLGNRDVRIILRTGQPGMAPEREVVLAYDINDYKTKTDLTAQRLFTTVVAALRAFSDIQELNRYRQDAYAVLGSQNDHERQILDLVPTPVVHLDRLGVVTGANRAFLDLVGLDETDVVGFPAVEVLPEEAITPLAAVDAEALSAGTVSDTMVAVSGRRFMFRVAVLAGSDAGDLGLAGLFLPAT